MKLKQKGFTLIELLVTTGIVGILATISFANFEEYKASAYDMHAVSAVREGMNIAEVMKNDFIEGQNFSSYATTHGCSFGAQNAGTPDCYATGENTISYTIADLMPSTYVDNSELYFSVSLMHAISNGTEIVTTSSALHCKGKTYYQYREIYGTNQVTSNNAVYAVYKGLFCP